MTYTCSYNTQTHVHTSTTVPWGNNSHCPMIRLTELHRAQYTRSWIRLGHHLWYSVKIWKGCWKWETTSAVLVSCFDCNMLCHNSEIMDKGFVTNHSLRNLRLQTATLTVGILRLLWTRCWDMRIQISINVSPIANMTSFNNWTKVLWQNQSSQTKSSTTIVVQALSIYTNMFVRE